MRLARPGVHLQIVFQKLVIPEIEEQLFDKQRIAGGFNSQLAGQLGGRINAEDGGGHLRHGAFRQR